MNAKMLYLSIILLLIMLFIFLPLVANEYIFHFATLTCLWIIIILSLNLVLGYLGMLNLAHIGMLGIGAYISAILSVNYGVSFWIAFPLAGASVAVFGILMGLISIRCKERHHFAITTLMITIALYSLYRSWEEVTGGYFGIGGIPRPDPIHLPFGVIDFRLTITWYYFILLFTVLSIFFFYKLANSRMGRVFVSIREDEELSITFGFNTRIYKIVSFAISGFFCGLVGSLFAHSLAFISPEGFAPWLSFEAVIYNIFGGVGTIIGPIFGTIFLRSTSEILLGLLEVRLIIFGILIILLLYFLPEGMYPFIKNKLKVLVRKAKP